MTISLQQLRQISHIDKVIIHSLDCSLYQVSVEIQGNEEYVSDHQGHLLRSHNKLNLQEYFSDLPYDRMVLRQSSAYDEMVGQPQRQQSNEMEVSLGKL